MLWTPTKEWEGQDAYLIGGGASLRQFNFDRLKGLNTIGCNDAFRLGKDVVKYVLFGDASFFHKVKWELEKFGGPIITCAPSLQSFQMAGFHTMKRVKNGLSTGNVLGWNFSTGGSAINLAISLGAKRIFLLGYDVRLEQNISHWHDHRPNVTRQNAFDRFLRGFKCIADHLPPFNVEVIHVINGESKLPWFRQMTLDAFSLHLDRIEQEKGLVVA